MKDLINDSIQSLYVILYLIRAFLYYWFGLEASSF